MEVREEIMEMNEAMNSTRGIFENIGPDIYEASDSDRTPCCVITEGAWTWFGSVLLTLSLLALFHMKYKKKVINRPKNLKKEKNSEVLRGYLLAQQKAARTVMPDGSLSVQEFSKCCAERRRYPIIFKIEFGSAILVNNTPSYTTARLPDNKEKNRTEEIVANDENRVVIKTGDINTDYINASYCSGLVDGQRYIITQVSNNMVSENMRKMSFFDHKSGLRISLCLILKVEHLESFYACNCPKTSISSLSCL